MKTSQLLFFAMVMSLVAACGQDEFVPKPKAYYRISFPAKSYVTYQGSCPYIFEYPQQSLLDDRRRNSPAEYCWMNLHYPQYNATLHLSYKDLSDDLAQHVEDSRSLAMKHLVKANGIDESRFENPDAKVYGVVYDFSGNTATNMQFYLTDSTQHFIRGALYFNMAPNADSLKPVIDFIKMDIKRLIETFQWQG